MYERSYTLEQGFRFPWLYVIKKKTVSLVDDSVSFSDFSSLSYPLAWPVSWSLFAFQVLSNLETNTLRLIFKVYSRLKTNDE